MTARDAVIAAVRENGEPMHWSAIGYELGRPPGPGGAWWPAETLLAGVREAVADGGLVEVSPQVYAVPDEGGR